MLEHLARCLSGRLCTLLILAVITEADRMILVDIKTGWFKLLERHGIDVGHCPWTAEPPDGVGEANPGFGRRTK
jgi:hypothetical protein